MKKLAIDIALRLTFSKWIHQAFPVSIAFIPSTGEIKTIR